MNRSQNLLLTRSLPTVSATPTQTQQSNMKPHPEDIDTQLDDIDSNYPGVDEATERSFCTRTRVQRLYDVGGDI